MVNICRKPLDQMFSEFEGKHYEDPELGSGDVKYHLGYSHDRLSGFGEAKKNVHISLLANPSHLEAVNPVVMGKIKAKQHYANDTTKSKSMGYYFFFQYYF